MQAAQTATHQSSVFLKVPDPIAPDAPDVDTEAVSEQLAVLQETVNQDPRLGHHLPGRGQGEGSLTACHVQGVRVEDAAPCHHLGG